MILKLSGRCLVVSECSLRRKACRRVSRDESHDIDRRRAATGLARARARSVQSLGVGVPSARRGRSGAGANHGAWERAMIMRVSAGARPRVVQTEKRTCTCQKLETGRGSESAAAHVSLTSVTVEKEAKTSPFLANPSKCMSPQVFRFLGA